MYRYGSKQPSADYCAALYVKFNVVYAEIFLLANELFTLRSHNVYYMDAFSWNDVSTYISALFSTMISLQLHTTARLAPLSMLEFTLWIPILWKFLCKCFMVRFWKNWVVSMGFSTESVPNYCDSPHWPKNSTNWGPPVHINCGKYQETLDRVLLF